MSTLLMRLAVIPGLVIIVYIYAKDKVEKEPVSLILKLLLLGVLCCFVAAPMESLVSIYLPVFQQGTLLYAVTNAFLVAGVCEELVKLLALRLGSWHNPSFNYRFDGIVYGVSVAVGFAIFENIMYVSRYGLGTAIVRAFTAVPLHSFCGAIMGIFYSCAKRADVQGRKAASTGNCVLAFAVPMIVHGIYDTFAMVRTQTASIALFAFVILLYVMVFKMVNVMSEKDHLGSFRTDVPV